MAGLADVFDSAVETAFTVFADLVKTAQYVVAPIDSGWGDVTTPTEVDVDVIVNGLSQKDLKEASFYVEIQPTDTVVMVKGKVLKSNSVRVRNTDQMKVNFSGYTTLFNIVAHDTDPAEALYLILLREVKDVS